MSGGRRRFDADGIPYPSVEAEVMAHYARWRADEFRQQQIDLLRIVHEAKDGTALEGETEAAIVRWAKLQTLIEALEAQALGLDARAATLAESED